MPRRLALALVFACSASAGIWPGQLGKYQLKSATAAGVDPQDRARLDELGFEASEQADYGAFQVIAQKFKDTTGAYAASLGPSPRPESRVGNYVVSCSGNCPKDFPKLAGAALPGLSQAAIPTLSGYLPTKGLIPHSERYIVGPVGLRENAPEIPESAVGFQFGTEGAVARYRTPRGDQILEAIPNAVVKRTGPLIAVVLPPAGQAGTKSDAAEELLSLVNYGGSVAWSQPMPLIIRPQTMAQILVAIFMLAGVVIGFCVISGLAFALIRIIARKFGYSDAEGTMTTLHLGGK